MTITRKQLVIALGVILLLIGLSFYIGYRYPHEYEDKTEVKYIKSDPIKGDTITPEPIIITETDSIPKIFYKTVTLPGNIDTLYVDSSKIIDDWKSIRRYDVRLFNNDSLGSFRLLAITQFNKLDSLSYIFTPITKVTTITKYIQPRKWELFGGVGISSNSYGNVQIGGFKNHIGISYQFNKDFQSSDNYHTVNLLIRY